MLKDYFKMAVKNLRKRKMRSWLTLIGIFIGIAAVVGLISLGSGLEKAVAQQFQILGAEKLSITAVSTGGGPPGTNVLSPLTTKDLEVVLRTRGIEVASGRIILPVVLYRDDFVSRSYLATLPRQTNERNFVIDISNYDVEYGRMLKSDERTKVVMGASFRENSRLGRELRVGDEIIIKDNVFEVVGFLKRTGSFQVDGIVLMNEEIVRSLFNDPVTFSVIEAKPSNIDNIYFVADEVRSNLRRNRGVKEGREDFTVSTNQDILDSLSRILSIVTYVFVGIAAISLIVGGVGIMTTMFTSVMERNKEIGIMKSIGARNSDILKIFLFEAGLLGLIGGIIGVILGSGLALLVEFVGRIVLGTNLIQAVLSFQLIFGALLFSFFVGAVAGVFPAYIASRMNPVDALRD